MKVSIYVRSHFEGNPRGTGSAAALVEYIDGTGKTHTREQKVCIWYDTKNALELQTCIAAMRLLVKPCDVMIYINNDYIKNACQLGWLERWHRAGWKKAKGKELANVDGWRQFYMLTKIHRVTFEPYTGRYQNELERILQQPYTGGEHGQNKKHCDRV